MILSSLTFYVYGVLGKKIIKYFLFSSFLDYFIMMWTGLHLFLSCIISGGSPDGRETALLNGALFGGANGTAARDNIDGPPADVKRTDGVASTEFRAN